MGNSCCQNTETNKSGLYEKKQNKSILKIQQRVQKNVVSQMPVEQNNVSGSKVIFAGGSKIKFTLIQPSINSKLSEHMKKLEQNSTPPQSIFCSNLRIQKFNSSNIKKKDIVSNPGFNEQSLNSSKLKKNTLVAQSQIEKPLIQNLEKQYKQFNIMQTKETIPEIYQSKIILKKQKVVDTNQVNQNKSKLNKQQRKIQFQLHN